MAYFNTLKNTNVRGPLFIDDDPTLGGPQASLHVTRNAAIDGTITTARVDTSLLKPQGSTEIVAYLPIPDYGSPGCLSSGSVLTFPSSITESFQVDLPLPMAGYIFYLMNYSDYAITLFSGLSHDIRYEDPIGTFNTFNSATLDANAKAILAADGDRWFLFANSALLSTIAGLDLLSALNTNTTFSPTPTPTFTSGAKWIFDAGLDTNYTITVNAGGLVISSGHLEAHNHPSLYQGGVWVTDGTNTGKMVLHSNQIRMDKPLALITGTGMIINHTTGAFSDALTFNDNSGHTAKIAVNTVNEIAINSGLVTSGKISVVSGGIDVYGGVKVSAAGFSSNTFNNVSGLLTATAGLRLTNDPGGATSLQGLRLYDGTTTCVLDNKSGVMRSSSSFEIAAPNQLVFTKTGFSSYTIDNNGTELSIAGALVNVSNTLSVGGVLTLRKPGYVNMILENDNGKCKVSGGVFSISTGTGLEINHSTGTFADALIFRDNSGHTAAMSVTSLNEIAVNSPFRATGTITTTSGGITVYGGLEVAVGGFTSNFLNNVSGLLTASAGLRLSNNSGGATSTQGLRLYDGSSTVVLQNDTARCKLTGGGLIVASGGLVVSSGGASITGDLTVTGDVYTGTNLFFNNGTSTGGIAIINGPPRLSTSVGMDVGGDLATTGDFSATGDGAISGQLSTTGSTGLVFTGTTNAKISWDNTKVHVDKHFQCDNGFTVNSGAVSFPAASINVAALNVSPLAPHAYGIIVATQSGSPYYGSISSFTGTIDYSNTTGIAGVTTGTDQGVACVFLQVTNYFPTTQVVCLVNLQSGGSPGNISGWTVQTKQEGSPSIDRVVLWIYDGNGPPVGGKLCSFSFVIYCHP